MSTTVYISIIFVILGSVILFFILEKLTTRYRDMFIEININAPLSVVKEASQKLDLIIGIKKFPTEDPDVCVIKIDTGLVEMMRIRHFKTDVVNRHIRRVEAVKYRYDDNEILFPNGDESFAVEEFQSLEDGKTLHKYSFHVKASIISYYIKKFRITSKVMIRVRDMAEGRVAALPARSEISEQAPVYTKATRRWLSGKNIWQICSTFAALAAAIWQFGFLAGPGIVCAVIVHEFGHAIGFRLVGERVLGIQLIPFLGGVTIGTPPGTALKSAIVALSGTTFSFLFAVVLFSVSFLCKWLFPGWYEVNIDEYSHSFAGNLNLFIFVILIMNLLQLMPVSILDGGRTVSAMFSCFPWQVGVTVVSFTGFIIAAYLYREGETFDAALTWLFSLWSFSELLYPKRRCTIHAQATYTQALCIGALYILHIVAYVACLLWLTFYIATYVPAVKRVVEQYTQEQVDGTDEDWIDE